MRAFCSSHFSGIDLNRGMKLRLLTSALSIAALTLAVPACKKKESTPPATTGSATTGSADMAGSAAGMAGSAGSADMAGSAAAGSAAAATLTDPQIAAIVVAANQVDIDAGNLAAKKTKNAEVKKFAELMVKDHTAVNKSAVDLVTKLKVTPEETDTSKSPHGGWRRQSREAREARGRRARQGLRRQRGRVSRGRHRRAEERSSSRRRATRISRPRSPASRLHSTRTSRTRSKSKSRSRRAAPAQLPTTTNERARPRSRVAPRLRQQARGEDVSGRDQGDAVRPRAAHRRRR